MEYDADVRVPLRKRHPERNIKAAKEAAFQLINKMLWTLEGKVEEKGVNMDDETRALKLLAGLNAAIPKPSEELPKPLEEMTEEELRQFLGKKK